MFQHIPPYAGDPILSLMEQFNADTRSEKVNLSIGLYYNEDSIVPQLETIIEAQKRIEPKNGKTKLYLPMEGFKPYREAIQTLLFGANSPAVKAGRAVTIQTLGGSGALKVGADFLKTYFPNSDVWVSQPTWDNHVAIFNGAGIKTHFYPYFDAETRGVDFDGMLSTLKTLPEQSIVLLHPCCHNPTGADLNPAQWDQVIAVLKERNLIPFLDIAYQGFGDGMEEDAYAIRALDQAGLNFIVSNSFSKIFSLYGERVGGLTFVCDDAEAAQCTFGQLKATVRRIYSSPPTTGAWLVDEVLNDGELNQQWQGEVKEMRERIIKMRSILKDELTKALPDRDFSYLVNQKGMFSYTGLTAEQVDILREEYAIYLVRSGRICVAGLNMNNVYTVAKAMAEVLAKSVEAA
ncbi:aromatic amino acid transaminase [Acinetobacter baumannii]|uniref:amino acid aminotransferase n=1 Tax=Acinetobacter baumannii TaxID=470 RepID=UPI0002BB9F8B|nr:amino acid aminotransferase [Acinetobacter baumannii]MCG6633615.1 aminotransferase class I/II-fold pyridoxal phosphate-dependent enzyme [Acinetobacter baumannii]MCJ9136767.1 aspartate/tyrosine/aromatic aminotransferase [Acinetobacter baumannii]MCJ9279576.1 aspartate/tyrosine/aromatic aminotransferase [Acinetobacter baumannii]MCJ9451038.1 aspartate/tyrosine/aromatic aminotransferase [Acinetobacter baumannii]MCJ9484143.1 aspartate/tyrosine/aromatic aminotransferase [Acinetobacter baumannii]